MGEIVSRFTEKEITISFILPVYNAKKYIGRCVSSLLEKADELRNIEIIIVDDGSSDGSAEICHQLEQSDERIIYLWQSNSGASAARNAGINCAKGQFIAFVDADDYVENGYLHTLISAIMMNEADMYVFGYKVIKNEVVLKNVGCPVKAGIYSTGDIAFVYGKYGDNTVWNKIFRKSLITNSNIQFNTEKRIGEDFQFIQDYILVANKVAMIDYRGYFYNLNAGSVVANTKISCFFDNSDTIMRTIQYIRHFNLGQKYEEEFYGFMRVLILESIKALLDKKVSVDEINECLEASGLMSLILSNGCDNIRGFVERYLLQKRRYSIIKNFYIPILQIIRRIKSKGKVI